MKKHEGEGGSNEVRVVLVTVPDRETGLELSRAVVEEGLAACGSLVPGLTSVYRWEGEIQEDPEVLLILKTATTSLNRLMDRVEGLHPYDVPEILALPVSDGHPPYLDWVLGATGSSRGES